MMTDPRNTLMQLIRRVDKWSLRRDLDDAMKDSGWHLLSRLPSLKGRHRMPV
jgi:hypothetical protein